MTHDSCLLLLKSRFMLDAYCKYKKCTLDVCSGNFFVSVWHQNMSHRRLQTMNNEYIYIYTINNV